MKRKHELALKNTMLALLLLGFALVVYAVTHSHTPPPPPPLPPDPATSTNQVFHRTTTRTSAFSAMSAFSSASSAASMPRYVMRTDLTSNDAPIIGWLDSTHLIANCASNELCYLYSTTNLLSPLSDTNFLGQWTIVGAMTNGSVYTVAESYNAQFFRLRVEYSRFIVTPLASPNGDQPMYLYNIPMWFYTQGIWGGATNCSGSYSLFSNSICLLLYPLAVTNITTDWPCVRVIEYHAGVGVSTNFYSMHAGEVLAKFEVDLIANPPAVQTHVYYCPFRDALTMQYDTCCACSPFYIAGPANLADDPDPNYPYPLGDGAPDPYGDGNSLFYPVPGAPDQPMPDPPQLDIPPGGDPQATDDWGHFFPQCRNPYIYGWDYGNGVRQ